MATPKYTPGPTFTPTASPPHGQSHKTLTIKVKAHTRKVAKAPKGGGRRAPATVDANGQPILPGSSITRGQLAQLVSAAIQQRYGPQEQALGQQITNNQRMGTDIQGWYKQYQQELQGYKTDAANQATATNQAFQNLVASLGTLDQTQQGAQNQSMAADAASRGATVGPQVATDANHAQQIRQGIQGAQGGMLAAQGAAATGRATNLADVVAPIQRLQALVGNQRAGQDLASQLTGLKGQEGAFGVTQGQQITQNEASNLLNQSIQNRLGMATNATIQNQKATRKETHRSHVANEHNAQARLNAQGEQVNQYGYTVKAWQALTPAERQHIMAQVKAQGRAPRQPKAVQKPRFGPGSLTPTQENGYVTKIENAEAAIQRLMAGPGANSHEVRQLVENGFNPATGKYEQGRAVDHWIVNAAFDLVSPKFGGLGGLSPANLKTLQRKGIRAKKFFHVLQVTGAQGMAQTFGVTYTGPNR